MSDSYNQPPELPRQHRSGCGAWLLGCFGTSVLLLLLAGISIGLYFRGKHRRGVAAVQAEVDRIHAAGQPITTEDMVAFHRVPDGVFDATQLWIDAIDSAAAIKPPAQPQLPVVGEGKLSDLQADAPQSLLPQSEQFLAAHALTIDKTRTASAAGGQCRYPIKFADGIAALLPHIQEARTLARILSLRLNVSVAKGDVPAAIESLELELALAHTMDHEPLLITQLVRMALVSIALSDARRLVSELPLSDAQLAALQKQLAALDARQPIKEGMLGERAMGFHTFHHLSQVEGVEMLAGEDGTLQRPEDCRFFLGLMREMVEASDQPAEEARRAADQVENKLKARLGTGNPLDRLEIVVTALMFPATSKVLDSSARTQAARDAAIAGIAFRRYQLKHGSPPSSLAALVPEFIPTVPLDPFAAGSPPLILVIDGDQFAIYSVGVNGQDDRVLLRDPESSDDAGFVARLTVPAAAGVSEPVAGGKE